MILALGFPYFQALAVLQFTDTECPTYVEKEAKVRVTQTYFEPASRPIKMCMDSPALAVDVQYGATHFLPFVPAINVIGPKGTNVDVIAHEWVHAETEHVLGFMMRNYKIPVWLDEGIAMQADYRPDYSRQSLKALIDSPDTHTPRLEDIAKAKDFFTRGAQGRLHYALAKCVVAEVRRKDEGTSQSDQIERLAELHEVEPSVFGKAYTICTN